MQQAILYILMAAALGATLGIARFLLNRYFARRDKKEDDLASADLALLQKVEQIGLSVARIEEIVRALPCIKGNGISTPSTACPTYPNIP